MWGCCTNTVAVCEVAAQILWQYVRLLHKYCGKYVRLLHKYCGKCVRLLHKYCGSMWGCCTNTVASEVDAQILWPVCDVAAQILQQYVRLLHKYCGQCVRLLHKYCSSMWGWCTNTVASVWCCCTNTAAVCEVAAQILWPVCEVAAQILQQYVRLLHNAVAVCIQRYKVTQIVFVMNDLSLHVLKLWFVTSRKADLLEA